MAPVAKPRPKFRVIRSKSGKGHTVMTYYPNDYAEHEAALAEMLKEMAVTGKEYTGPVKVDIICTFEPPPSLSKKERAERLVGEWHSMKPDGDNLGKCVMDAMNHIKLWVDDCQVADLRVRKVWGVDAGIFVRVDAL